MQQQDQQQQLFKIKLENCVRHEELESLYKKFNDFAPLYIIKDIQDTLQDFTKRDEFNVLEELVRYLKKDINKLCTKEEYLTRFNVFNSEMNTKLTDRPTSQYLKKVLQSYDEKIN